MKIYHTVSFLKAKSSFYKLSKYNFGILKIMNYDSKLQKLNLKLNFGFNEIDKDLHLSQLMDICQCDKCFSKKTGEKIKKKHKITV